MKRRNFIKGLCKATAIATVVPTALTSVPDVPGLGGKEFAVPFSYSYWHEFWTRKFILGHDPVSGHSIAFKHYELFDGPINKSVYEVVATDYDNQSIYLRPKDTQFKEAYDALVEGIMRKVNEKMDEPNDKKS